MKISNSLFYRNVTALDFAYVVADLRVIGNSLYVDVEFAGDEDADGVLYDFSSAKHHVKKLIDKHIDHKFIVPDKMVTKLENEMIEVFVGGVYYKAPREAFCLIDTSMKLSISYDDIEKHATEIISKELPLNVKSIKIHLREEEGSGPFFCYTHGLKNHYGNCQRLLHGHRNQFEIWTSGIRRSDLEHRFVKSFFGGDVHFVFWDNVVNKKEISSLCDNEVPIGRVSIGGKTVLTYISSQGTFYLEIPTAQCYFVKTETTIENLSRSFVDHCVKEFKLIGDLSSGDIEVRAYEGIGKGSCAVWSGKCKY